MEKDFSKNLRSLCAGSGSFAEICRNIGINRQQFNRYINGHGMPSVHNLHRIARYFEMRQEDLMLEHDEFLERFVDAKPEHPHSPANVISDLFKDQTRNLRRFLGTYHIHFRTPSWPDHIFRSLLHLREESGYVVSHTYERAHTKDLSIRQKTRYSGLVTFRGSRIYLVEHARSHDGFISESILFPAHRQQVNFVKGQMLGVAVRPRLTPYSSPLIWKRIPERVSAREALSTTGIFPLGSDRIDPVVKKYLSGHMFVNEDI